jgi:hypothetical protein
MASTHQAEIEKSKVNSSTFQELEPLLANFNFGNFFIFQNWLTLTLATFLFSKLANFNHGYFCYFLIGLTLTLLMSAQYQQLLPPGSIQKHTLK